VFEDITETVPAKAGALNNCRPEPAIPARKARRGWRDTAPASFDALVYL